MNLDNILVKAKEVFESAYKKADDVVSTQKQKFDISSLESKLNKDYEALGRLCYEAIKDGQLPLCDSLKETVEEISEKTGQIEEMKKDILKAKNKKLCPKCNAAIDKTAFFCNVCGVKLADEEE